MTTFLSPIDLAPSTQTGRRVFRKQILRKGEINYQGRKVVFDDGFLKDVVKSFKRGAYDQVPFVFADPDNRHNMDPERFRGEVKGLELTPDGVDMIVEATADGARVIKNNPRLGVSARIVQGLEKSDGRTFKRAIQHVLATMDPRLTGMKPWETVDLSDEDDDDDEEVIDLTAATVKEGKPVGTKTKKAAAPQVVQIDLSQLNDGEFKDLLLAAAEEAEADAATDTEEVTRTTRETLKRKTPKQRKAVEDTLDDDEDDDLEDDDEAETSADDEDVDEVDEDELADDEDDEDADEEVDQPVSKKKRKKDVKLSTPVRRRKVSKARRLELKLAAQEWREQKGELVRAGVPPFLVDLATPVMAQPDKLVIDLSESGERDVDAKAVIGKMLDGVKGMIDLAPEMGHGISSISDDKDDPTRQRLALWEKEYGKP